MDVIEPFKKTYLKVIHDSYKSQVLVNLYDLFIKLKNLLEVFVYILFNTISYFYHITEAATSGVLCKSVFTILTNALKNYKRIQL